MQVPPDVRSVEEDRQLVKRLLAGEERAFGEFFESYFGRLFRFALTRTDQDQEAARDVVQETMIRAIRNLQGYRGEAAFFTWLCQICRSRLAEHYEKSRREAARYVPIEDDPEVRAALEVLQAGPDSDPEAAAHQREVARLVQVALDNLPARYASVLEWKYVEGLPVQEIAARLEVGFPAAQSLLQRARAAFREGFETLYGVAVPNGQRPTRSAS
jgi:RNA polymerase sigma-70 factor (ECF subfamily)